VKLSPHEIAYIAKWAGFTDDELVTAVAVALAESGGDTDVMGRSTVGENLGQRDHGLWQISGKWHGDKLTIMPNWRNGYTNARLAYMIFVDAGRQWTPWHVFTSGAYRAYLPDAEHGVRWPFKPATLGDRL
jgi:Lysozyme like domain